MKLNYEQILPVACAESVKLQSNSLEINKGFGNISVGWGSDGFRKEYNETGEARNTAWYRSKYTTDRPSSAANLALSAKTADILIKTMCTSEQNLTKNVHQNYHTSIHMRIAFPRRSHHPFQIHNHLNTRLGSRFKKQNGCLTLDRSGAERHL